MQYVHLLSFISYWGEPERAPLLHGKQCSGPCVKNRDENAIATHYCSLGTVVHVQTNTINLRILPYKCMVMQKYSTSFTDVPYMAGAVNHATNNEMKIIDTLFGTWYCNGKRGEAEEESNIVLEGTQKLLKRGLRLEARTAHERRQNAMMSTEQRQILLQRTRNRTVVNTWLMCDCLF